MLPLPLVHRELLRATRRPRSYWARIAGAVVAVMFWLAAFRWAMNGANAAASGRETFFLVASLSYYLSLVAGAFTTSLTLFEEKSLGTLPLLLLTRIGTLGIVLGKLAGVAVNTLQILLGTVPVLAACFGLGGVSAGEFGRTLVVLASTLFFSLAAGILAAAWAGRPERAVLGAVVLISGVVAGLTALDQQAVNRLHEQFPQQQFGGIVPGPGQAWQDVPDLQFRLPPESFWDSVSFTHALGWSFVWLAVVATKRTALDPHATRPEPAVPSRLDDAATIDWTRHPRPSRRNPIVWLAHRRWHPKKLWTWLGGVTGIWTAGLVHAGLRQSRLEFIYLLLLPIGLHLVIAVALTAEAASRLGEARRSGELELALVTPLRERLIGEGYAQTLMRQFALPVGGVAVLEMALSFFGGGIAAETGNQGLVRSLLLWAMAAQLVSCLPALAWTGLWAGLKARNPLRGTVATLWKVFVGPQLVLAAAGLAASPLVILFVAGEVDGSEWWLVAIATWLAFSLAINLAWTHASRRSLSQQLRQMVQQRLGY